MNKTGKTLTTQKNTISIYITADFPSKGSLPEILEALQASGVGMVEIGIPFSDPLADGPVIQQSSTKALNNGFTISGLFDELSNVRSRISMPLTLMGYFNTLLAFGIDTFLSKCQDLDIDTVIIPDLTPEIYQQSYVPVFTEYNVSPVFFITPLTDKARIQIISGLSHAFVYAISGNSITGSTSAFSDAQMSYFQKLKGISFPVPLLIGFGISDNTSYRQACENADGVIIGSAYIKAIEHAENLTATTHHFIQSIQQPIL
ncbi:MAG: tryptophan synthase subunit alpha [Bacteroidota bacterium]|nr:tryptophan synthase subunit alpha [Bacteroidota bacterium]